MEIEDDSLIVVAESKCRYRRPARYDDLLRIRTRVLSVKRRTIHFGYEILHDETSELLAKAKPFTSSAIATETQSSARKISQSFGAYCGVDFSLRGSGHP